MEKGNISSRGSDLYCDNDEDDDVLSNPDYHLCARAAFVSRVE